ncbi:hypothetical protein CN689_05660 [Peribacillus butanolivorans]|uniref:Phage abortive infection protein n=1 Tax=Peribacillus butanolivorans TaxID=421767 RepID=A0AAX0S4T5_9BACI|nr:hypothetical protein [Peribacillus butanolivorans]PEJ35944.1 hypothetical protein CN689_05660 [Peribacillus butanolivorans]
MSNDFKKNQSIKINSDELVTPIMIFAMVSPVFGYFMVKLFGISFDKVGTYGDFIGGSTVPFLTTITILYIYQTNNLQREQLKIQKSEFSLLQQEMESTKEALQDQSKTTKMQRFENSFFIQIKEVRDAKKEIVVEYNNTAWGRTSFTTYKAIMSNFQDIFYTKLHQKIETSSDDLFSISEKDNKKEYYKFYGELTSAAIDESGIHSKESIQNFLYLINRCLQLIYHYKNIMDEWEITFYLEYLYKEITKDTINLVIFDMCLHGPNKSMIRELNFDQFADRTYIKSSRVDFRLINYILYQESD